MIVDVEDRDIARFMADLAATTVAQAPAMPSAQSAWLKAQLLQRWAAERRVERPLQAMQTVHIGLGIAAAVMLMSWAIPLLLN